MGNTHTTLKEWIVLIFSAILGAITAYFAFRLGLVSNGIDLFLGGLLGGLYWLFKVVNFMKL